MGGDTYVHSSDIYKIKRTWVINMCDCNDRNVFMHLSNINKIVNYDLDNEYMYV